MTRLEAFKRKQELERQTDQDRAKEIDDMIQRAPADPGYETILRLLSILEAINDRISKLNPRP